MQYILTTMSDSYPMITPCSDGTFQIQLESTTPFDIAMGPSNIPGLKLGKKLNCYWVEFAGKEKRIQPLDWYVLQFFREHREGTSAIIAAYLATKGYKNARTNGTSTMTPYGAKQLKSRIDGVFRYLGCPAKLMRKKGSILEINYYGRRDET